MGKRLGLGQLETLVENLKRELAMGAGTSMIGHLTTVETITADKTLTRADSGKMYLLDATDETGAVTVTLPTLSTDIVGTHYTFCVTDPSDGGFGIKTGDVTDTTGDMFVGYVMLGADQASDTSGGANGRMVAPAANDSLLTMDGNLANGGGEAGSTVKVTAVSATTWYCEGFVLTDDANSTGASIFSNAS
tara:strand:- start:6214 stop:6786 length:573 start_codon:yes stop_codon:yes gene_type:complete